MNMVRDEQRTDSVEDFAAELTTAVYSVALRHGLGDQWADMQLELWRSLTARLKQLQMEDGAAAKPFVVRGHSPSTA